MPTLKQIAADLGVSHALVSRVLNNRLGTTRVSDRVRQKIIEHAKKVDYQPNAAAIALKSGHKGVVGVFLHGVGAEGTELSLEFIRAASKALSQIHLHLWLQFFETDEEFIVACNERVTRRIDGLILAGMPHEHLTGRVKAMEQQGLHVVSACDGSMNQSDIVNFQVNPEQQCYLPTQHLIEKGCQRIAHISTSAYRYAGFLKAHIKMGVKIHEELVIHCPRYTVEGGIECTQQLLARGHAFDGLVAQSDAQASGVMQVLMDAGIPKKEWPLITGVDDSPIAKYYSPYPITSTTTETATCAHMAVEAIQKGMAGMPVTSQMVDPRLFIRRSSDR